MKNYLQNIVNRTNGISKRSLLVPNMQGLSNAARHEEVADPFDEHGQSAEAIAPNFSNEARNEKKILPDTSEKVKRNTYQNDWSSPGNPSVLPNKEQPVANIQITQEKLKTVPDDTKKDHSTQKTVRSVQAETQSIKDLNSAFIDDSSEIRPNRKTDFDTQKKNQIIDLHKLESYEASKDLHPTRSSQNESDHQVLPTETVNTGPEYLHPPAHKDHELNSHLAAKIAVLEKKQASLNMERSGTALQSIKPRLAYMPEKRNMPSERTKLIIGRLQVEVVKSMPQNVVPVVARPATRGPIAQRQQETVSTDSNLRFGLGQL